MRDVLLLHDVDGFCNVGGVVFGEFESHVFNSDFVLSLLFECSFQSNFSFFIERINVLGEELEILLVDLSEFSLVHSNSGLLLRFSFLEFSSSK